MQRMGYELAWTTLCMETPRSRVFLQKARNSVFVRTEAIYVKHG